MTALGTISHAGQGRTVAVGPDRMTVKGASDSDAFTVVEYAAAPGVPGPPPHVHHGNEEGGDDIPAEVITLMYNQLTMEYFQQADDGTLTKVASAGWDRQKVKGVA